MIVASDCEAILNGGPQTVNVKGVTVDEIESMEVYPSGYGAEIRTSFGLSCPVIYVWTR